MARRRRVAPIGIAQHVIQRGNNRQVCFALDDDKHTYLAWLQKYAEEFHVHVHAWVLMSNHVHLLCTPLATGAVAKMMQSVGRVYVKYFNNRYQRTGTLWEGRYKSNLVESESYLLRVYGYIELNPVRAGMVAAPSDYAWSSYSCNALGKESALCTPHERYDDLGPTPEWRGHNYRALIHGLVDKDWVHEIRRRIRQGHALGPKKFAQQIEALTGQRVTPGRRGRPKQKMEKEKMGSESDYINRL